MNVQGIELKPGMILSDDKDNRAIVIPHKNNGVAFVSYNQCCSWSTYLKDILHGKLKEIRDFPKGGSLVDGELLWKETKYRINDGAELSEEQFQKEIKTYIGKEVQVRVI